MLAGSGVGSVVGVGVTVGGSVGPGVEVSVAVGVRAERVVRTIACSVGFGVKTASSGGDNAYLMRARSSLTRQPTRS